jgi:hypothetical protein
VNGFTSGMTDTDRYVTGGTYSNGTATFTNNSGGTFNVNGFKTSEIFLLIVHVHKWYTTFTNTTGGTFNVSGFNTASGFDIRVTGGTYSNGTATFTNNSGETFNVNGFSSG